MWLWPVQHLLSGQPPEHAAAEAESPRHAQGAVHRGLAAPCFFCRQISRRMPTGERRGPVANLQAPKDESHPEALFPMLPSRIDLASGVRRRRAPKKSRPPKIAARPHLITRISQRTELALAAIHPICSHSGAASRCSRHLHHQRSSRTPARSPMSREQPLAWPGVASSPMCRLALSSGALMIVVKRGNLIIIIILIDYY